MTRHLESKKSIFFCFPEHLVIPYRRPIFYSNELSKELPQNTVFFIHWGTYKGRATKKIVARPVFQPVLLYVPYCNSLQPHVCRKSYIIP